MYILALLIPSGRGSLLAGCITQDTLSVISRHDSILNNFWRVTYGLLTGNSQHWYLCCQVYVSYCSSWRCNQAAIHMVLWQAIPPKCDPLGSNAATIYCIYNHHPHHWIHQRVYAISSRYNPAVYWICSPAQFAAASEVKPHGCKDYDFRCPLY